MKVKIKIGRYIKNIGKDDLILDNGSIIQVVTQYDNDGAPLRMSKKLFKELNMMNFIYIDKENTKKMFKKYRNNMFKYYKFNIDKLIEYGYEIMRG